MKRILLLMIMTAMPLIMSAQAQIVTKDPDQMEHISV